MNLEKFLNPSGNWDSKYRKSLIAAIRQYQPERADAIIQRYLSRKRRAEFNMVNTYSRQIFRWELLAMATNLDTNLFQPDLVRMLATFTPRDWAHCDRDITFDYDTAKQKLRNAFTGMNFIGVIEPAYYPKVEWERDGRVGRLISFHAHVLVWDTSESKLRRHQRKIRARFLPVDADDRSTPTLNLLKTLEDLAKVLRYCTKMPWEGYDKKKKENATEESGGGKRRPISIEQRHVKLKAIHHYRLFNFLRKHTLFDAWLGGGNGAKLLRETRKAALVTARNI